MLSKTLIKIIVVISLILGAMVGLVAVIPPLTFWAITLLMLFIAPFIIIYFKRLNLLKTIETEKGMLIGAISGFSSFIGFSVIFFPVGFLVDAIFKIASLLWVKVVIQNIVFLIGMVFFIALLCAMFNAFTGFLTAYIYQYFNVNKR